eukprot:13394697-Ditylum_brightwellii.AAC.1
MISWKKFNLHSNSAQPPTLRHATLGCVNTHQITNKRIPFWYLSSTSPLWQQSGKMVMAKSKPLH